MSTRYARIAFSEGSVARQRKVGSDVDYAAQLHQPAAADVPQALETSEMSMIRQADSMFVGTVTPDGWPYIQHRGGPKGFVHVVDSRTLAFADLSGNQQYVTAGNLDANDRVTLFFVDYPLRRRLKVFGRAVVREREEDPDLLERLLEVPGGRIRSRAERSIVIAVEATDSNCSSHIKPRYGKERIDEAVRLERERLTRLAESR